MRHLCAAAHSRQCAALSQHVRIACLLHRPRRCTDLGSSLKRRLASVSQLWTLLAGAISSLSIEVVEDSLIGLPIVLALQPARVISFPVVSLTRESTAPLELGTCACGPINRREPRASQSQWSETAGEDLQAR